MGEKIDEFILTSDIIDDIEQRENLGKILKRYEKVWFQNLRGVRKPYLTFAMSEDEFEEYIKCKINIHYFAEKYCQIKREDGSIGPMKLREYQKDIIDLYDRNRFSILMASRQVGKCLSFNTLTEIKNENGDISIIPMGILYFNLLKQTRPLTILESIKYLLYKIYFRVS